MVAALAVDQRCKDPFHVGLLSGYIYPYIVVGTYPCRRSLKQYSKEVTSQTSDNMNRWKSRGGKSQRRGKKREDEKIRSVKRKSQKKEYAGAGKGRKVAIPCAFPMTCGSGGSKSRLARAAGAEPSGQMRDEQLHAIVGRSTFRCEKVKRTSHPRHFWTLGCEKNGCRCGAKHIPKRTSKKHLTFGPLLVFEMSKTCTPLWREAHFQVKMLRDL